MERLSKINLELNNDLSAEDFQEKLYQWLEEQGILPGLRTYLRHQLISALKRTHLSSDFLNKKRSNLSVKDTSLNLLIAEYLVQQNYQYTASIFYSEEPRLGQLPIQLKLPNEGEEPLKFFTENEVEEVLESLNLVHSSTFVREVIDTYSKHSTSLLKAIIKSIAAQSKNFKLKKTELSGDASFAEEDSTVNRSDDREYRSSAEKVNKLQTVKHQQGKSMTRDKEKSISSESKEGEMERKMKDAVIKLRAEMEKELAEQRKTLEDSLMAKQQRIVEMVNHLQDQQVKLQDHFKNIQEKEMMLEEKEKRLDGMQRQESIRIAERRSEIKSSQEKLEEEFQRLRQEKHTIILLQKEMEATHKQIIEVANYLGNSQMELNVLQSLNLENKQKNEGKDTQLDINGFSSQNSMNLSQSLRLMQENAAKAYQRAIQELREKNLKLQTLANEQQSKINKLSVTVSSLNIKLEDATAALRLLSMQDDNKLKSQPTERQISFSVVKKKSDHEEFEDVSKEKPPVRKIQKSNEERIHRRQRSKEESESSTASSPTEEILREARQRLRRLEIESDEVDRRYYKFKQKHLSEGLGISSLNLSKDIILPLMEKNTSWMKWSREAKTRNTSKNARSVAEVDDEDPVENHPANEKGVSSNFSTNHSEYNQKAKEESSSVLLDMNSSIPVKSLADHITWIASSDKNTLENNKESSSPIHLVPNEMTSPRQKLPSKGVSSENQKEDSSQRGNERHWTGRNHPYTSKLSDNLTQENHQLALKAAEKNPEMKGEDQINSITNNNHNHSDGKIANISTRDEKMEDPNDSQTSSSAKLSVGAIGGKAEDSFW